MKAAAVIDSFKYNNINVIFALTPYFLTFIKIPLFVKKGSIINHNIATRF